jgi:hypothetical protein
MNTSTYRSALRSLARGVALTLLLLAAATLGCSRGNKGAALSGKVTINGGPVKGGQIRFQPVAGGVEYPGSISPQGTYTAANLPPGEMKVVVDTEMVKSMRYPAPKDVAAPNVANSQEYVPVPPKYRSFASTPLRVTVTGKNQTQDFDLAP